MCTIIDPRRLMAAVAAALVAGACGGSPTMPALTLKPAGQWTPAPPPTPLAIVTGTVYEHSPAGPVALAGIALDVSEVGLSRDANVVSDAAMRIPH